MTLVCRGPGSNSWPPVPRSGHSTTWATWAGLVHGIKRFFTHDIWTCLPLYAASDQGMHCMRLEYAKLLPVLFQVQHVILGTAVKTEINISSAICLNFKSLITHLFVSDDHLLVNALPEGTKLFTLKCTSNCVPSTGAMCFRKALYFLAMETLRSDNQKIIWATSWENLLCHMRTTGAQISLRIRAVWSAPLLFVV